MATPTSHPRPSPSKNATPQNHLTPPSTTGYSPQKYPTPSKRFTVPNGAHGRHPSGSHKMSDLNGENNVPMSRTATNASTPSLSHSHLTANLARTGSAANTPTPARSAGESPAVSALMQELQSGRTPSGPAHESPGMTRSGLLGLTKEQQEEDRKRRLEQVVEIIGKRWGYVCQDGVEMVGRRLGFNHIDWEESMTGEETRTLNLAGEGILVEVEFRGETVMDVRVGFPEGKFMEKWDGAAAVLKDALLRGESEAGYKSLDAFALELERLGRMDKLLATGKVNGFDAVGGIGKALDDLHAKETEDAKSKIQARVQDTVMCSRSGRPVWNARKRVGFAVQYWKEQRLVTDSPTDDAAGDNAAENHDDGSEDSLWALAVECEPCALDSYPSARISDKWLSEPSNSIPPETNTVPITGTNLSWLEPPPGSTSAPSSTETNGSAAKPTLTPRFTATFNPPILLPLQTVLQIHENANAPIPQEALLPTSYSSLLFPANSSTPLITERSVRSWSPQSQTWSTHSHRTTLFTSPSDLARELIAPPFRHPMELINILPTLRQWALVSTLLRNSASTTPPPPSSPPSPENPTKFPTLDDELAAFLSEPRGPPPPDRDINISFTFAPQSPQQLELLPQFQVTFADPRHAGALASVGFVVGVGGVVERVGVMDGGSGGIVGGEENGAKREGLARRLGRVVEVLEDLGRVVEWVVRQ